MEHFNDLVVIPLNFMGIDLSITFIVLILWLAAALVFALFLAASRKPTLIPNPLQGMLEALLEFFEDQTRDLLGEKALYWLPFLIALFCFILFCNLLGLIPGFTSPTANLNVTAALAITVFLITQAYAIFKQGPAFVKELVPEGIPKLLVPFFIPIELLLLVAKPFSLAIRLFANLFAGHTVLFVILGLLLILKNFLIYPLPIAGYIVVGFFEVFIGFIQAFIFTFLTAFYLSEVIAEHP